jgi:glucose-1-phosphate cytidylyltransferase
MSKKKGGPAPAGHAPREPDPGDAAVKTLILCGGKGTRLGSEEIPKALVEIGGRPILSHILRIYQSQGFGDFVLCLGYKGAAIKEHFLYKEGMFREDFALEVSRTGPARAIPIENGADGSFRIVFAETGEDTPTGGRIKIASKYAGAGTFMVTYGDGVADVDLRALLAFHRRQGTLGTVTVVNPASQFGEVVIGSDGKVREFREKPKMEKWVNGGFFVFEPGFLDYLREDDVLERAPLERLAKEGQLSAFRHEGFWRCMDTFKDASQLNELWARGEAPWKRWE